ncbi:MAG: hypothetical protein E7412_03315 [Ruminococcaceae bacterium]|nr:hypothetical protein [Oscillospiraceae bacterium]
MYVIKEKGSADIPEIVITDYINTGYSPKIVFSAVYSDKGFHAHFVAYEKNPRITMTKHLEFVHKDSCLEWFMNFDPVHTDGYFNFEMNAGGVANIAFRKDRYDKTLLSVEDIESLDIRAEVFEDYWTLDYTVPFELLKKYIPDYEFKKGLEHPANVYKCGDETEIPHWGCWSMVNREKPDFHVPSYFGKMTIE